MDVVAAIERLKVGGFDKYTVARLQARSGEALTTQVVEAELSDILQCLVVINRAANGEVPSELVGARLAPEVLSNAVYWVSLVITGGLKIVMELRATQSSTSDQVEEALLRALTIISHAWSQVVAGDVDDLYEDLRHLAG